MRVSKLVRGEATPDSGLECKSPQLGTHGRGRPGAATRAGVRSAMHGFARRSPGRA
jgi:hypothetical protein